MRGADVSSDHDLLMTTVRLRLKISTNANSTRTRYNVGLFRNKDTQADTEAELKQQGTNWTGMARAAQNRVRWRGAVDGLCSTVSDGHK